MTYVTLLALMPVGCGMEGLVKRGRERERDRERERERERE